MSLANCCEWCDDPEPLWVITRTGDAVITWACGGDLSGVCERLQRDDEVTELTVRHAPKAKEWAGISRTLGRIADGGPAT